MRRAPRVIKNRTAWDQKTTVRRWQRRRREAITPLQITQTMLTSSLLWFVTQDGNLVAKSLPLRNTRTTNQPWWLEVFQSLSVLLQQYVPCFPVLVTHLSQAIQSKTSWRTAWDHFSTQAAPNKKKQHTLVFLVSLCGPLLCFLSTRYVFVSPGCPLVCSFNVLRAVMLWCFWCAFLYSIFVVALVSSSCKEQLALQLRSALTRSCAFELNGLNRFFSFIFAGGVFVLFARFRPSTVNFRNCWCL